MNKRHKLLQILIGLIFVIGLLGPTVLPAGAEISIHAHPLLVQLAEENPDQMVSVIVQKLADDGRLEAKVAQLGGRVTKDLHMIHAFAAEMKASAALELASSPLVRWVSLDVPIRSATTNSFTTWAIAIGTEETNSFSNAAVLVDSNLGPNGTYGVGLDGNKASFIGFQSEVSPGNSITKVEVLLNGYATVLAHDFKAKVWVGGSKIKDIIVNKSLWTSNFGLANAGTVVLDITSARAWKWADFENQLAISLDLSQFDGKDSLSLDAIGLRVTSEPGTDTISDTGGDTSALATLDTSKQVNYYNKVIRASDLWNTGTKLQGKGVTIAVVDSGVYKTKDLGKRIRANVKFNAAFHDAADRYGHGTFVAGIVAGNGSSSGNKYMGVAPRADLLNVRVSDDQGMAAESDVISGLQWVLDNKGKYNIRAVNLSLNSSVAQSYHTSPLCAAVEILWFNGIVVVTSAGNNGTAVLFPPANDPFVITVGATDDKGTLITSDDNAATFSASGVTESGFAKPDLVTPGRNIIGLLPENDKLSIGKAHPYNRVDTTYFKMSGTSVSAPMVSGAVALLLQDEPTLTPDQVKYRLMATANRNWPGYNATTAGAGYLDIYAAVFGTTTESANTGVTASQLLWTGGQPVTWGSVAWNSVAWNSVAWNSVAWNSVAWNSVAWNSDYWEP
jgi:serine protease AprX